MLVVIRDVQVSSTINRNASGFGHPGASSRAVVAAVAKRPVSCHGRDYSVGDLPDAVIVTIDDVEVSGSVYGEGRGIESGLHVQLSTGGRTVVAAETWGTVSCHSGYQPARDHSDAVIARVGDIEVA